MSTKARLLSHTQLTLATAQAMATLLMTPPTPWLPQPPLVFTLVLTSYSTLSCTESSTSVWSSLLSPSPSTPSPPQPHGLTPSPSLRVRRWLVWSMPVTTWPSEVSRSTTTWTTFSPRFPSLTSFLTPQTARSSPPLMLSPGHRLRLMLNSSPPAGTGLPMPTTPGLPSLTLPSTLETGSTRTLISLSTQAVTTSSPSISSLNTTRPSEQIQPRFRLTRL